MTSPAPSVSVVIAQWGKTDFTARSVDAIRRSNYTGPLEVLVYDNASPGGPGPIADRQDVALITGDENIGFGPAINRLAEAASGELLLILNNDTIVDARCITRMVAALDSADRPGAVTPQYRSFSGQTLEMGGYLGPDASAWQLFRSARPPRSLERLRYRAHYGSAACLLVERARFCELGGFDDAYAPAYYEDSDLCLSLAKAGRPTVVEPSVIVFHYEGGTAGRDTAKGLKTYQIRNQMTLLQRWSRELASHPSVSLDAALAEALAPRSGHRVLWLSPHLPRPDRDAGGARIIQMLESLRADGHFVALWAEHCHDADRYGPVLEAHGVPWFGETANGRGGVPSATPRAFTELGEVLDRMHWDAVVISFPDLVARVTELVRSQCPEAAIIADPVDLHFLREGRAGTLGIATGGGSTKDAELNSYRSADGVITASDLETEILLSEIPGLAAHTFAMSAEPPAATEAAPLDGSLLFLGNFHHHPNVDAVEWWVEEIAPEVARLAGKPIPLRVVGSGSETYRDVWATEHVDLVGWVEDLADEFVKARVFLAPLRYGAGTKGKISAALARRLPTITTSIGAEGMTPEVLDVLDVTDDVTAMAAMAVELMTDDAQLAARRKQSLEAAESAWHRQQALSEEFASWIRRRVGLKA